MHYLRRIVPALAAIFGFAVSVEGALVSGLINVDFNGGSSPTATGAALIGQAGDQWNPIATNNASNLPLFKADGTASDVTLSVSARGVYDMGIAVQTHSPVNPALLGELLHIGSGTPGAVTLSGLSSSVPYEIYVFSAGDTAGRTTPFTITGATVLNGSVSFVSGLTTYESGQNYLRFELNPDPSGTILINFAAQPSEGNFNGFQIAPIPEPATASLLLLAGLPLMARRRQRPGIAGRRGQWAVRP